MILRIFASAPRLFEAGAMSLVDWISAPVRAIGDAVTWLTAEANEDEDPIF